CKADVAGSCHVVPPQNWDLLQMEDLLSVIRKQKYSTGSVSGISEISSRIAVGCVSVHTKMADHSTVHRDQFVSLPPGTVDRECSSRTCRPTIFGYYCNRKFSISGFFV
ncbi:unnamed protein product, partial [Nesidiocoris tenuis]